MIGWKECPENIDGGRKYCFDAGDPTTATKIGNSYSTIVGNTPFPPNSLTSVDIKVQKPRKSTGISFYVGVAPIDVNQDENCNFEVCGWYLDCCKISLYSGPPHSLQNKAYGPRDGDNLRVHPSDVFGVVMDTTRGDLSFTVGGIYLGAAYTEIPLDKPLAPCAIIINGGDSVTLIPSSITESAVSSDIPVPTNLKTESKAHNSITVSWPPTKPAMFYEIEIDGSRLWGFSTKKSYEAGGLLPDTEHTFRVRAVAKAGASEWSAPVTGRTLRMTLETGVWASCPDSVIYNYKYVVEAKAPRKARKVANDGDYSTVVGNTPLPLGTVSSWRVSVVAGYAKRHENIWVGVAPFDIDQNKNNAKPSCGWFFGCMNSTLCSGPPHKYKDKSYGPKVTHDTSYVSLSNSVGVIVDTVRGDVAFVLSGVHFGIAYEGVPLDKPLVPCVILSLKGDVVELLPSPLKLSEVNCEICAPTGLRTKSTTWDSITVTWDPVDKTSYYQIEYEANKCFGASANTRYIIDKLAPATGYTIRVRAVKGSDVGPWSEPLREITQKPYFEHSEWRECPDYVNDSRKYVLDEDNPKIAVKPSEELFSCAAIGNTPIPQKKVTPWCIKLLKTANNGEGIYVGVAPSDVDQDANNPLSCGWFFSCYNSSLFSGPPHKYTMNAFGPRKGKDGKYVSKGDYVGIIMDTSKSSSRGELSFTLNFDSLGVAFKGMPLDKPLVPCAILTKGGDSVEIIAREDQMPKKEEGAKGKKFGKNNADCIIS